jgi:hypothetical protein
LQNNFDRFNNALYKEKEMADFRRCMIVLAALALMLGTAVTASAQQAQPFTCTSTATPLQMRAEGITEKAGDFVLACVGGNSPAENADVNFVNIQIFLNTPTVTSRILTTATNATEALLLVDEPTEAEQVICPVGTNCNAVGDVRRVVGVGGVATSPYKGGKYNSWQGQLAGPNSIVFSGVPIAAPGTAAGAIRTIRITNVRADASALGVPPSGSPYGVTESIATSNGSTLPITSNTATQVVGLVQRGLIVTVGSPTTFQQCFSETHTASGSVTLAKGFGAAFKVHNIGTTPATPNAADPQDVPGNIYNTEDFYYNPTASGLAGAGRADFGTRFKVLFSSINNGVTITVPVTLSYCNTDAACTGEPGGLTYPAAVANIGPPTDGGLFAQLITSEAGPYAAATSGAITADSSGNGMAVYEVLQANTSDLSEKLTVWFDVTYVSNPGSNIPALGTSNVDASFAPVSTIHTASPNTVPIPRFIASPASAGHFTINKCATHLLFPFVTSNFGFDTGLAISNTSMDPYTTSTQVGKCTLHWYQGDSNPADLDMPSTNLPCPVPTGGDAASINPGTTCTTTALTAVGAFQGYVIADCQFQYAHGFAFVTKVGATDVAMGYLALVIPDPPRNPNPVSCPAGGLGCGAGSGEQLGQ